MPEITEPINWVKIDMVCDSCGEGRMQLQWIGPFSLSLQYLHKCDKCGFESMYEIIYPFFASADREKEET